MFWIIYPWLVRYDPDELNRTLSNINHSLFNKSDTFCLISMSLCFMLSFLPSFTPFALAKNMADDGDLQMSVKRSIKQAPSMHDLFSVTDKNILITGASSGLGEHFAKTLSTRITCEEVKRIDRQKNSERKRKWVACCNTPEDTCRESMNVTRTCSHQTLRQNASMSFSFDSIKSRNDMPLYSHDCQRLSNTK